MGNKCILVVCDYAKQFPEAFALKSIDAEHVAEALMSLFSRVGVPKELLMDQGTNFTLRLLEKLHQLLGVKAIRTSPYHSQTDGLVKRSNGTLKAMPWKFVTKEGKDWDQLLLYVLFVYEEVPQATTGFLSFELLYGRAVQGPLDILKETWDAEKESEESVVSYILPVQEKLAGMMELVKQDSTKAKAQQKTWYDHNARERELQSGGQVLVLLPTSTSKLLAQCQGPYEVLRKVGKVNYEVLMTMWMLFPEPRCDYDMMYQSLEKGGRSVRDWTCCISGELLAELYVLSLRFIFIFRMCVVSNYFL